MAPAQAVENGALARAMGSSEENWSKAMALGTGLSVFSITLRRQVESTQVAQACREVMNQHAILRSQIVENSKGRYAFVVKSDSVVPTVVSCPWPKDDNTSRCSVGDIAAAAFLKTAAGCKELKEKKKDDFSFTSVSTTTEKELAKSKQFSEIPVLNMLFSQVLKHPGVTPQSSLRTALFSLFVDETPFNQWTNTDKLQVAAVCGPFPSMHRIGPCFAVCDTMLDGNDISISLMYPTQVYSRAQMKAFAASVMNLLDAVSQGMC
uniref:Condensation domain-containing protein n=1 Tax=Physcomitrium patens TaxID=3218 RepID=A0A7I4BJQ9_PHYPA